ncbi:MAG: hypothetical protein L0170_12685 [Acidobacteria bacterium]|nr:hypothetical protein [Acidobacteriota bacterium]
MGLVLDDGQYIFTEEGFPRNNVGGGDSIYVLEADGSVFNKCVIAGSPRAAVMYSTVAPSGVHGPLTWLDTEIDGGFTPIEGQNLTPCKWGQLAHLTKNWAYIRGEVRGIGEEHAFYFHNIQGDHLWTGVQIKHCGRTAIQIVNRKYEGSRARPMGVGNVKIVGCRVTDVCLEQGGGGSALTFNGGMPTSNLLIKNTSVSLGNDPALMKAWQPNITGSVVCQNTSSFPSPGANKLTIDGCTFVVGTVYPGYGAARRSNVKVNSLNRFEMTGTRIEQGPDAFDIALEIGPEVGSFWLADNTVIGKVKYGGQTFDTYQEFLDQKGGLMQEEV